MSYTKESYLHALKLLEQANNNPFELDTGDELLSDEDAAALKAPEDWSVAAARGVVSALSNRGGFDDLFGNIDLETRVELIDELASVIEVAQVAWPDYTASQVIVDDVVEATIIVDGNAD